MTPAAESAPRRAFAVMVFVCAAVAVCGCQTNITTTEISPYIHGVGEEALKPPPKPFEIKHAGSCPSSGYAWMLPRFSSDGGLVVYADVPEAPPRGFGPLEPFAAPRQDGAASSVWLGSVGTQSPSRISGPLDAAQPAWSPDGRSVVFTGRDGEGASLFVWDASDGAVTRLTDATTTDLSADFSPDGSRVVYSQRSSASDSINLWTTRIRGRMHTCVTRAPGDELFPRWSPDGRLIAFVSLNDAGAALAVTTPDGTGSRILRDSVAPQDTEACAVVFGNVARCWSPDSKHLAFLDVRAGRIAVVDVLSSELKHAMEGSLAACWSSDGRVLAVATGEGLWLWVPSTNETSFLVKGQWIPRWWSEDQSEMLLLGPGSAGGFVVRRLVFAVRSGRLVGT